MCYENTIDKINKNKKRLMENFNGYDITKDLCKMNIDDIDIWESLDDNYYSEDLRIYINIQKDSIEYSRILIYFDKKLRLYNIILGEKDFDNDMLEEYKEIKTKNINNILNIYNTYVVNRYGLKNN